MICRKCIQWLVDIEKFFHHLHSTELLQQEGGVECTPTD